MAVAVAEIQMARADLRIAYQDGAGVTGGNHVGRGLKREGRRGACDIHVEAEAFDAERVLHFHRHCGVSALQVRGADQDPVNIRRCAVGRLQGFARRTDRHLRENRNLLVRPLWQTRAHDFWIKNAGLVDDIARLDARRLDDELGRGFHQRRLRAGGNGARAGCVRGPDIGVESRHQLFVRNRLRRRVKARPAHG